MKTRKRIPENLVRFQDILPGDCFTVGKKVYIKAFVGETFYGVSIVTGECVFFSDTSMCHLLLDAVFEY